MEHERQNPAVLHLSDDQQLQLQVRDDRAAAAERRKPRYTGALLLKNQRRCQRMVEMLMAGWGLKRTARALHASKQSVVKARDALVASGEIDPYKKRVIAVMEEIIELGSGLYLKDLEENKVPPVQLPVGVGIFADKRAQALGEPARIGLEASAPADFISVDRIRAWLQSLPGDTESHSDRAGSLGQPS